jgi:hypothetical protein
MERKSSTGSMPLNALLHNHSQLNHQSTFSSTNSSNSTPTHQSGSTTNSTHNLPAAYQSSLKTLNKENNSLQTMSSDAINMSNQQKPDITSPFTPPSHAHSGPVVTSSEHQQQPPLTASSLTSAEVIPRTALAHTGFKIETNLEFPTKYHVLQQLAKTSTSSLKPSRSTGSKPYTTSRMAHRPSLGAKPLNGYSYSSGSNSNHRNSSSNNGSDTRDTG